MREDLYNTWAKSTNNTMSSNKDQKAEVNAEPTPLIKPMPSLAEEDEFLSRTLAY